MTELHYSTVISPNDDMWNMGSQWEYDVGSLPSQRLRGIDCLPVAIDLFMQL